MTVDWPLVSLLFLAWSHGFLYAWAANNQHQPFWRGFVDWPLMIFRRD
jgi:hypothetical protein